jgi:hypothetical protein
VIDPPDTNIAAHLIPFIENLKMNRQREAKFIDSENQIEP